MIRAVNRLFVSNYYATITVIEICPIIAIAPAVEVGSVVELGELVMLHGVLSTTTTNTGQDSRHYHAEPPAIPQAIPLAKAMDTGGVGPDSLALARSRLAEHDLLVPVAPRSVPDGDASAKGGLAGWQLRRVIGHIEENLGQSLACCELAAVARLSTGHFCRAFKTSVGEPPHAYVIRQRIRHAQRLMLRTDDALSEIACICGLTDQAHLTRLFRRVVGNTPRAWRNRWRPLTD